MARQYPPKNINYNPNLITGDLLIDGSLVVEGNIVAVHNLSMHGNIIFQPDQYMTGNVFTPYASKINVNANEDYSVGIQDRILILSSTNASEKTILLNDFDEFICELTIVMLTWTNGLYKIVTTIQGDISYSSAGTANTFIHLGNGSWSLSKF